MKNTQNELSNVPMQTHILYSSDRVREMFIIITIKTKYIVYSASLIWLEMTATIIKGEIYLMTNYAIKPLKIQ